MNRCASRVLSTMVLATALVLGGCSQGSDTAIDPANSSSTASPSSTAPSSSVTGTPPAQVTGRSGRYSLTPPADWRDATAQASQNAKGANLDLVLLSSKPVEKFSDNLVIVVSPGDEAAVKAELKKGRVKLSEAGRTVTDADDVTIAGTTAKGLTSTFEQQGIAITARSYAMAHQGKIYLLTLSSSTAHEAPAQTAFAQIASSWQWT